MTDDYISKDELIKCIDNVAANFAYISNGSGSSELERQLDYYIERRINEGIRQAFQHLVDELIDAPSGGLCLLCKNPTPSEDEQN